MIDYDEFCRKCQHYKFDFQKGILCNLTNQKPAFTNKCEYFLLDSHKESKPAHKSILELSGKAKILDSESIKKRNRKKHKKVAIIITSILLAAFTVYSFYHHQNEKEKIKKLLFYTSSYEINLNKIAHSVKMRAVEGDFTKLTFWFLINIALEKNHYHKNNSYVNMRQLEKNYSSQVDSAKFTIVDEILKNLSSSEVVSASQRSEIIKMVEKLIYLDKIKWKAELELSENHESYKLFAYEKTDMNYDKDSSDYFVFDSQLPDNQILFVDNENSMDLDDFTFKLKNQFLLKILNKSINNYLN